MFSRPEQHSGQAPRQPRVCRLCGGDMAVTDFHEACIVCLGVKHAYDAVYSPGGSQVCPACDLFSPERRKVRLDNVRAWIPPQPADAHSDPAPRWFRGPSLQHNNNSTTWRARAAEWVWARRVLLQAMLMGRGRVQF